jgi:hypothetical protein
LKSNGDCTGVSASGEINFTAGPREIPRVAKAPAAGGKAASFALINGAADKGVHIAAARPTSTTYLIAFISFPRIFQIIIN